MRVHKNKKKVNRWKYGKSDKGRRWRWDERGRKLMGVVAI